MASELAVARCLGVLSRAFAGAVDEARVQLYHVAFDDLTDEQVERATALVVRNYEGQFIPPPAVIRKAVAPATPVVETGVLVQRISNLGSYNAQTGWIYPSAEQVRERLGGAVAYAYSAAGRERLYSENATTREIAMREFDKALLEASQRGTNGLPVLESGPAVDIPRQIGHSTVPSTMEP